MDPGSKACATEMRHVVRDCNFFASSRGLACAAKADLYSRASKAESAAWSEMRAQCWPRCTCASFTRKPRT